MSIAPDVFTGRTGGRRSLIRRAKIFGCDLPDEGRPAGLRFKGRNPSALDDLDRGRGAETTSYLPWSRIGSLIEATRRFPAHGSRGGTWIRGCSWLREGVWGLGGRFGGVMG